VGEVLKALEYAHRKMDGGKPLAIVHRDVSPHNVMVSFAGEVKLTDFGIAKATSRLHQTQGDLVKGKIAYMAPEQAVGAVLDGRADLFAVGGDGLRAPDWAAALHGQRA
jgi:serine/threonine protein kinase